MQRQVEALFALSDGFLGIDAGKHGPSLRRDGLERLAGGLRYLGIGPGPYVERCDDTSPAGDRDHSQ